MPIDFDDYPYYPAIRTRLWEMRGYSELQSSDRDRLLPLFSLMKRSQTKTVNAVASVLCGAMDGKPFLVDLEAHPLLACDDASSLLDPTNAFEQWRSFVGRQPGAIPVAQMPADAPVRDVVMQVRRLEQQFGRVAVRSRNPASDIGTLVNVLSAVDSVSNALIILDFGYIRSRLRSTVGEASTLINTLRRVDPTVRIVLMASSYPRSAAAYSESGATLEIEERTLHAAVGGDSVAIYGDHAAIHPEPFEPSQVRFVPRVDYALPNSWVFRRARADQGGFEVCARRITETVDWDPSLVQRVWGASKIRDVANGNLDGMGSPAPWIAVRVNLHLWQQIHLRDEPADDDFGEA